MIRDRRNATLATVAVVMLLIVSTAGADPAPASPALAGTTKDTIGRVLENAEVLLLAAGARNAPTAVARSGADGGFAFADLVPGVYKIAVVKPGYLTFVDRIDTGLQRWLDIVLHPAPEFGAEPGPALAEDAAWALRLPERSVLRETDPGRTIWEADAPAGADAAMRVEIDQLVALRSELRSAAEQPALSGTETRLRFASPLGSSGDVRVEGSHESLDGQAEALGSQARDAASMDLAFSYDTGIDSRVRVRAFLDQRGLSWDGASSVDALRHKERIWGWGAEWNKQLGSRSDVAVRLDYRDAYLALPGFATFDDQFLSLDGIRDRRDPLADRMMAAAGHYRHRLSRGHELLVGLQARVRQNPHPADVAGGDTPDREPGEMDLEIQAEDTWAVGGPFSLIYGLGYRHALTTRETSYLFPRVGAGWEQGDAAMRLVFSYHALADSRSDVWGSRRALDGTLGYEAEVRLANLGRVSLFGSSSRAPVEMDLLQDRRGGSVLGGDPTLLSDGFALLRRHCLSLVADGGSTRTFLEYSRGRAEGQLTLFHTFDWPVHGSADRLLRYDTARVGLKIVPAGTELVLGYEELTQTEAQSAVGGGESEQRSVRLGISQDLTSLENVGNWRLLMALRMISLDREGEFTSLDENEDFPLASPAGEVSAGVSVTF